eukprot:gene44371-32131_t
MCVWVQLGEDDTVPIDAAAGREPLSCRLLSAGDALDPAAHPRLIADGVRETPGQRRARLAAGHGSPARVRAEDAPIGRAAAEAAEEAGLTVEELRLLAAHRGAALRGVAALPERRPQYAARSARGPGVCGDC